MLIKVERVWLATAGATGQYVWRLSRKERWWHVYACESTFSLKEAKRAKDWLIACKFPVKRENIRFNVI